MKFDTLARIAGSILVIVGYFFVLKVNDTLGVMVNIIGDTISLPYFIRTKSFDVVIMIVVLLSISLSHLVTV